MQVKLETLKGLERRMTVTVRLPNSATLAFVRPYYLLAHIIPISAR